MAAVLLTLAAAICARTLTASRLSRAATPMPVVPNSTVSAAAASGGVPRRAAISTPTTVRAPTSSIGNNTIRHAYIQCVVSRTERTVLAKQTQRAAASLKASDVAKRICAK
jgi:hypothetical protein